MKLAITIALNNAAFKEEQSGGEVARILREIADEIDGQNIQHVGYVNRPRMILHDINGNRVGDMKVTR